MHTDRHDQIRRLLHALWSDAVGTPGYDKREWKAFEGELLGPVGWTSKAITLARQLRAQAERCFVHDAGRWNELELLVFRELL